jgi:hypothetical protein
MESNNTDLKKVGTKMCNNDAYLFVMGFERKLGLHLFFLIDFGGWIAQHK